MPCRNGTRRAAALRHGLMAALIVCCAAAFGNDETVEARRRRLAEMSAIEKEELRQRLARFERMGDEEQRRLRRLHTSILADPQRERLRQVMFRYNEWLKSLPSDERLALLNLPTAQRVEEIKKLMERQARERFLALVQKTLSYEDRDAIFSWLARLAFDRLSPSEQQRVDRLDVRGRRIELMRALWRPEAGRQQSLFDRLQPSGEDIQNLADALSGGAQRAFSEADDDETKRMLVRGWISAAVASRWRPSREDLDRFFDRLDETDKEYLENLAPDRKRGELERLYMKSRLRGRGFGKGAPSRRRGDSFGPADQRSDTEKSRSSPKRGDPQP